MSADTIPEPRNLPKKPLAEAIFEVRWKLDDDGLDPGFQVLSGRYYERVREIFPHIENLPTGAVPEQIAPHVVRQRFRKAKDAWPLTQVGPGILSVNDVEAYEWSTFKPLLGKSVEALFNSYPDSVSTGLSPTRVMFRYVNSIPFDPGNKDRPLLRFLKDAFHTGIEVEPLLFERPELADSPTRFALNLTYPLDEPQGSGRLALATGFRETVPSIIWENVVVSEDQATPQKPGEFEEWFDAAHAVIEKWFFTLCRGELLSNFEETDAD